MKYIKARHAKELAARTARAKKGWATRKAMQAARRETMNHSHEEIHAT